MSKYGSNTYGNSGTVTAISRTSGSFTATITVIDYGLLTNGTIVGSNYEAGDKVVITGVNTEFNTPPSWTILASPAITAVVTPATTSTPAFTTVTFSVTTASSTALSLTGLTGTVASFTENKFYYGVSASAVSVEPFTSLSLDYQKVLISWNKPDMVAGNFTRFRVLRNQDGVSDSQEDGIILLDYTDNATLLASLNYFIDGVQNTGAAAVALIPGRYAYYSIWLLGVDGWTMASQVRALIAAQHANAMYTDPVTGVVTYARNTHQKLMDILPRVFTSVTQSPLDEVDPTSDLYTFLKGFSYTLDELLTYVDLLLPKHTGINLSPELLNTKSYELGLTTDNRISTRFQRQLVREAKAIYKGKGTTTALADAIESMSGYDPKVTTSPNLILSPQDSTFRGSTGSWTTVGNAVLAVNVLTPAPTEEPLTVDLSYTAQVAVSTAGAKITNGVTSPITYGIPISAGTSYAFSTYASSLGTSKSLTLAIDWYDRRGVLLSTSTSPTSTIQVPRVVTAVTRTSGSATAVFTSNGHGLTLGATVVLSSFATEFNATWRITAVTTNTFSITSNGTSAITSGTGSALPAWTKVSYTAIAPTNAVYAAIEIAFGSVDTYYLDMVQFAVSTTTAFHEARGVEVTLTPSKVNYLTNPSFETAPSGQVVPGWNTLVNGTPTQVTDTAPPGILSGSYRLKIATASSSTLDLHANIVLSTTSSPLPGKFYTFSIYGRTDMPMTTLSLVTSATSGSFPTVTNTTPISLTVAWQRFQVTTFIPANFGAVSVQFGIYGATNGQSVYFDAGQVESKYSASDYFDGSETVQGAEWSGIAHASTSYMFPNKAYKIPRLQQEVPKYVPLGRPYIVSSQDGIEFKGFA